MVNLTVDGIKIAVEENTTILAAAKQAGVEIPTLCYLEKLNEIGACRICCVEVEGENKLIAACNNKVQEGMVVKTNTPAVRAARKTNIELILSEHDCHCPTCVRSGNCKLQKTANDLNVLDIPFETKVPKNECYGLPLVRQNSKCIKCMRCINVCENVQSLSVWDLLSTGGRTYVGVNPDHDIKTQCSLCGQCITHCPTGALRERDDTDKVYDALADGEKITVVQIAPAVRSAWGEAFGLSPEQATEKRMAAAVKALGFNYVFDTNFSADLTIMEEGTEFVKRVTEGGTLPMFTSCCPGWVRFMKSQYPELSDNLSTAKSPQQMFGAIAKSYFAEKIGVDPKNIFCVSIMPCTAKKFESGVEVLSDACGDPDVDVVLTTRELDRMLKADHIDVASLDEAEFDSPLGTGTGAAVIFGATGGVMEAALRTAVKLVTGNTPDADAFSEIRGLKDRRVYDLKVDENTTLTVAVTSGLGNARALIEDVKAGRVHYDFIEIMACPGGCAGGGGQPIHDGEERAGERGQVLYSLDKKNPLRYSHDNPDVAALYKEYLGEPLSHRSHELLHTDFKTWNLK